MNTNRRMFLVQSAAAGTAGFSGLMLPLSARATPRALDADEAEKILAELGPPPKEIPTLEPELNRTTASSVGPFYSAGAPFRAKVTPPHAAGTALIVSGRIWALDTRKPLGGAILDIWQVNNTTRTYSKGGGEGGENGDYVNRCRVVASETGYYEFETVHPVWYAPNPNDASFVRSPHIHFIVTSPGYTRLVSELFFQGDEKHEVDPMFQASLAIKTIREGEAAAAIERAAFDIILERAS